MTDAVRLLLVEDSETQALQFRLLLEQAGFVVDRTRTAEEALDRLNGDLPDLVVVDFNLPGMNGDELVRRMRQAGRTRTLPVLMLTDAAARDVERQGLDSGANAYLPKSSETEMLVSRMRALVRKRRAPATAAPAEAGFRQARILLIEDSATQRLILSSLLTGDGHQVAVAADEAAMLAELAAARVDCVLVGLDSLRHDATETCRRLHLRRQRTGDSYEIVGLAGGQDGPAVLAALNAGADDVVPRTEDRDMLLVRIRGTLRRKLARDEEIRAAADALEQERVLERARAEAEAAEALATANRGLEDVNARLRETQGQLVQAAKMASLGELVAGIAHEINNPLAFILAHQTTVERLVREGGGDDAKLAKAADRLGSMRTGLVRIQDLVVKLRRFSRLDDGEPVRVDIAEAIEAVLTLLGPKLGEGIVVTRRYDAPATLLCTPALVNQVVMNIVANAADVVAAEGGRIAIATAQIGNQYIITIGDNGPGVPEALRGRLFEPFFTTKDVGAGTGLGLAIAYGIVRAHDGTISVGDGPEGGALFTLAVPIPGVATEPAA
jgi:two-component system NtrC family sensor kinase